MIKTIIIAPYRNTRKVYINLNEPEIIKYREIGVIYPMYGTMDTSWKRMDIIYEQK